MHDTIERERRLIISRTDNGQNGGEEQDAPEMNGEEVQPEETIHIHYFPDAIVIVKEEKGKERVDNAVETTLAQPKRPSVLFAYATCVFYLLLVLSCIVFQVYALLNPPFATITIVPKSQTVTYAGRLQLGRLLYPLTLSQSQTVGTTGKGHQDARAATGTITFYNGLFTSQTIAAGTILAGADGIPVVTNQAARIPAGNPPSYGHVSVTAHAIHPGVQGNIPAYEINQACCAVSVLAKNIQPFSGGAEERDFQTVAPSDSATLAATLTKSLALSVTGALHGQLLPFEQLHLLPCTPTVTSDHQPGQEATHVTVSVSETCHAVAYNQNDLAAQARDVLSRQAAAQAGGAYSLFGNTHVRVTQAIITRTPHPLVFLSFEASGMWVYALSSRTQQQIKTLLAGKTPHGALQLLMSLPGVTQASLRFAGFGDAARLPKNLQNIHLVLLVL